MSHEGTILHADVDAFFAAVEQRDDPRLRGRPVIVGAGVVLAASYEAKARGLRTAMSGRQARRLCPQAVVVEPRMSAYAEASKAVFKVFEDMSPLVEGLSIDEAFLDVRGLERIAGTPADRLAVAASRPPAGRFAGHGRRGQDEVPRKVASGVAKPDGLLVGAARRRAGLPPPAPCRAPVGRGSRDCRQAPREGGSLSARSPNSLRGRWCRCSVGG